MILDVRQQPAIKPSRELGPNSRDAVAVRWGIDDISLGFDLTGSPCVARLNEREYRQTAYGRMLGSRGSFGEWAPLLGRSAAFWKPDNCRLYVQAKLADEGELCAPDQVERALTGLRERMAIVGIDTFEAPWVTRLDVAVDVACEPTYGKAVLDALALARLPGGKRVTEHGTPRSTVYFRQRKKDTVLARAYCRNLKTKQGEPFGLIRLEASDRFIAGNLKAEIAMDPSFQSVVWNGRYGGLAMSVQRLPRETQTLAFVGLVECGQMTYREAVRMNTFLDCERLGVAERMYPKQERQRLRAEVRRHGLAVNDAGKPAHGAMLDDLLQPFRVVWE